MSGSLLVVAPPGPATAVLAAVRARLAGEGWSVGAPEPFDAAVVDAAGLLTAGAALDEVLAALARALERVGEGGAVVVLGDAIVWSPGAERRGPPGRRSALAAVHAAVQEAAVAHGPRGVRVNAVVVGGLGEEGSPPLLRGDGPAGVAGAVAFLCSAGAGFVTGETVAVTGGAVFR
jgi:3-oxoacyl-[acyl-carrier protein] reductase